MITCVPWIELAKTARRIIQAGCHGMWLAPGAAPLPIRLYASPNFAYATVVAKGIEQARLFSGTGFLRVPSADDEILVLKFLPKATAILPNGMFGTVFPDRWNDDFSGIGSESNEVVVILGHISSVELQVPSHSIDVVAALRPQPPVAAPKYSFSLN